MHPLRCSITGALAAVLFVAVGFAALREADEAWDGGLFYLTLALLSVAVLLAARRTGGGRAFWTGFALFGWGYLGLTLIPSIEPRLITTRALAHLHHSTAFGVRLDRIRVIPDLDRLRACNLSIDDIRKATMVSGMLGSPEQEQFRRESRTVEYVRGSYILGFVQRSDCLGHWGGIILKASPEGEILRLEDVAKVEIGPSFYAPRWALGPPGAVTSQSFIHVGHSLFAWLAAWLGGVIFGQIGSGSGTPEVLKVGE